ncbi:MAG: hypothetical protein KN64_09435 [Sulfurovum sp. AS07-7]|nr:MAG: hypothetical protein KN64_09435 [Sulfurovum sp. AS07-7]
MKYIYLFLLFSFYINATTLNIDELINKAIQSNPDIKTMQNQKSMNLHDEDISKSSRLPTLNLNLDYNPTKTFALPQNGQFTTIDNSYKHADLTLNYVLFDFFQTKYKIEMSKNKTAISQIMLDDSKKLLAYKVKKTYDTLVLEDANKKIEFENLKYHKELLAQAKAFYLAGLKTSADIDSINASLLEVENSLVIAQSKFEKAKIAMQYLIGESLGDDFVLKNTLNADRMKSYSEKEVEMLKTKLLSNNNSLKMADLLINNSDTNIDLQKSKRYPAVNIFATYGYEDSLNSYDTKVVGVHTSISLFDGNKNSAEVQKAFIEKNKNLNEYESKKHALEETLMGLLMDSNRYIYTIKAKQNIIHSAQSARKIMNARYKEGLVTYIEVLDAIRVENSAKKALLQAIFERNDILNTVSYLLNENNFQKKVDL